MTTTLPRYLLFSESSKSNSTAQSASGRWHIVLESMDGSTKLEAGDAEPDVVGERLELLAVVRGLEALDQPSQVTLVTASRYVNRGLHFGIRDWQENGWQWERFGRMVPVKNHDLWRRVDHAMKYHQVDCRCWRFDSEPAVEPDGVSENLGQQAAMVATPSAETQPSAPANLAGSKRASARRKAIRSPWAACIAATRSIGSMTNQLADRIKSKRQVAISG